MEKRLIDANALMEQPIWLCGGWVGDSYAEGYMDALDKVEETVKSAPTVDAEPVRHGRWAETVTDGFLFVSCSDCGFKTGRIDYNYCPNCGAKMDEERKDDEAD